MSRTRCVRSSLRVLRRRSRRSGGYKLCDFGHGIEDGVETASATGDRKKHLARRHEGLMLAPVAESLAHRKARMFGS